MRSNRILLSLVLLAVAAPAFAGGPLLVWDPPTQTPWRYAPNVEFYSDTFVLSQVGSGVSNAQAGILVQDSVAEWDGAAPSNFSAAWIGRFNTIGLPNITSTNANLVIGADNAETNAIHVIYDVDGLITTNVLGAPPGVLGIATPEFGDSGTGILDESWVVLNGSTVSSGDTPSGLNFRGVVTHEMGHAINLAHTQTNGGIIFFGDTTGPDACATPYGGSPGNAALETMYPFIDPSPGGTGLAQATIEHPDDTTTLADIYPSAGYPGTFGRINGTVFTTDGVTEISGINVIARNVVDPFFDAVSALSGDFTQLAGDGRYEFTGLTSGADYVVYVDGIVAGGFSTTPAAIPNGEEYWNTSESESPLVDSPCDFDAIPVNAGTTQVADIKLNALVAPATIAVSPPSFTFTQATNVVDTGVLNIQNTAAGGSANLDWTASDNEDPSPATSGLSATAERVEVRMGRGTVLTPDWTAAAAVRSGLDSTDPRAMRGYRTPAAKATPTRPSLKKVAVADGGFELGPGGGWVESSTNFGTPLCDTGTCGTGGGTGPNSGNYWAWFGGIAAVEEGSVSQVVTFPNVTTGLDLEFFLEIPGCDSPADYLEVTIDGNQVFFVNGGDAACGVIGYQKVTIDVSAYADGAPHTLEFHSEIFATNGGGSNFFVDDIDLIVGLPDCTWLSVAPASGTTPAGGSDNTTLTVDSTGLGVGTYDCEVRVESNASNASTVIVPVTLNVTGGAPEVNAFVSTATANLPVALFSSPAGTGRPFTNALLWDTVPGSTPTVVDATISVTLTDENGSPIVGYPANQLGLASSAGGWIECAGNEIAADGPTDGTGTTTFSGALHAIGTTGPGELMVLTINDPDANAITYSGGGGGLDIRVNSADLDGFDGLVNLVDVGTFSIDFSGAYDFRSDFNWNGVLNLVDVGDFSLVVGDECPAPKGVDITSRGDDLEIVLPRTAAEPGDILEAQLMLRGPSASEGIEAWSTRIEASDNVEILDVVLPQGSLNLGEGLDLVVGTGGAVKAAKGAPIRLATVRLRALDSQPAAVSLVEGSQGAAISVGGELVSVRTDAVARLNDDRGAGLDVAFEGYRLGNHPNPFNPSTTIRFHLPRTGNAEVKVYDVSGRVVTTLRGGQMPAGVNSLTWRGTDTRGAQVVSGVYFYRLFVDGEVAGDAVKMNLLK